jgi:hypothetical protein
MSPEEREQMNRLCARIQREQDHRVFTNLVEELNELLERKEKRLASSSEDKEKFLRLMAAELNEKIEATSATIAYPGKSLNSRHHTKVSNIGQSRSGPQG